MGYTPFRTDVLIGLGASAISDTGLAYAQNHHQVETYAEAAKDGFPVFKGHFLTQDDLEMKAHILEISCHLRTTWEPSTTPKWLAGALPIIAEMESEGLVALKPGKLEVTETGRAFVRNVCYTLDPRKARTTTPSQDATYPSNPNASGVHQQQQQVYSRGV